jgi:hypothetical protein
MIQKLVVDRTYQSLSRVGSEDFELFDQPPRSYVSQIQMNPDEAFAGGAETRHVLRGSRFSSPIGAKAENPGASRDFGFESRF